MFTLCCVGFGFIALQCSAVRRKDAVLQQRAKTLTV